MCNKTVRNIFTVMVTVALPVGLLMLYLKADAREGRVLDKIVAVIEDDIILKSEVEAEAEEYRFYGEDRDDIDCYIMGDMVERHLLLAGAKEKGIEIDEDAVENELDRRMEYFAMQVGGRQQLEEYYGQSVTELKEELREPLERQMRIQQMRQQMLDGVDVSPREVREYFESIPEDSLPYYDTEVEVAQIVKRPEITGEERRRARNEAQELRERLVKDNESFETLAILYSDDDESSRRGGNLGFRDRSALENEYAAAAFQLGEGDISPIVETEHGFHIIQMLERRGDRINTRHILIEPSVTAAAEERARNFLDSIRSVILMDTLSFQEAATQWSDDRESRGSGGLILDPETGSSRISVDNLPSQLFYAIDTLNEGEISSPVTFRTQEGGREFRMFKLIRQIPPHRANLEDDYPKIRRKALENKKNREQQKWLQRKSEKVYIRVDDEFKDCPRISRYYQKSP